MRLQFNIVPGAEMGRKFVFSIILNACLEIKHALDNFLNYFVQHCILVFNDDNVNSQRL